MAKQKFRSTRPGGFSGVKAYMSYVKVLKNRRNAVGRTFCAAINLPLLTKMISQPWHRISSDNSRNDKV